MGGDEGGANIDQNESLFVKSLTKCPKSGGGAKDRAPRLSVRLWVCEDEVSYSDDPHLKKKLLSGDSNGIEMRQRLQQFSEWEEQVWRL